MTSQTTMLETEQRSTDWGEYDYGYEEKLGGSEIKTGINYAIGFILKLLNPLIIKKPKLEEIIKK